MKLAIIERATLINLLPKEGSFDTLKSIRKLRESLSLSESEMSEVGWRLEYRCPKCGDSVVLSQVAKCGKCDVWMESTGNGQFNTAADPNKDVFISPSMLSLITSTLGKLNDKGKLTEDLMPIYEKFCYKEVE